MAEKPIGPWVRMQASAWMDPAVMAVKPLAELLFYRSIMHAKMTGTGGHVHPESLRSLLRDLHKGSLLPARLVEQRLSTPQQESGGWSIRGYAKYNPDSGPLEDIAPGQARKPARRGPTKVRVSSDDEATPHAGVLTDKQTDIGSDRTPSGSVRSEPAQAAPRVAGGATQPAPTDEVSWAPSEAQLEIRRTIAEAKTKARRAPEKSTVVGTGKESRHDFSAALAKLTEAAERLSTDGSDE